LKGTYEMRKMRVISAWRRDVCDERKH
jgi:hypothetical protein